MRDWSAEVDSLFGELNRSIRGVAKRVRSALGDSPLEVLGYRGYGNARTALVHGRVVARRGVGPSSDADSTLENLLNTYRRADSDPVPSAQLAITFGDTSSVRPSTGSFACIAHEWSTEMVHVASPLASMWKGE